MKDVLQIDYSAFDRPEILRFLFHPRPEGSLSIPLKNAKDFDIPVEDGVFIGARLHHFDKAAPVIIFFHGNGEIVSDYSGFAYFTPLLHLLGVNINAMEIREREGLRNIDKIQNFYKPARFIHAEYDHIIPFRDAQALFDACPASDKKLIKIPGADHNTIFYYGMNEYMNLVKDLLQTLTVS